MDEGGSLQSVQFTLNTPPRSIFSLFERTPLADLINFRNPELGVGVFWPSLVRPIYKSQRFRLREIRMAYQSGVGC